MRIFNVVRSIKLQLLYNSLVSHLPIGRRARLDLTEVDAYLRRDWQQPVTVNIVSASRGIKFRRCWSEGLFEEGTCPERKHVNLPDEALSDIIQSFGIQSFGAKPQYDDERAWCQDAKSDQNV